LIIGSQYQQVISYKNSYWVHLCSSLGCVYVCVFMCVCVVLGFGTQCLILATTQSTYQFFLGFRLTLSVVTSNHHLPMSASWVAEIIGIHHHALSSSLGPNKLLYKWAKNGLSVLIIICQLLKNLRPIDLHTQYYQTQIFIHQVILNISQSDF
jgi:hypothetical protein